MSARCQPDVSQMSARCQPDVSKMPDRCQTDGRQMPNRGQTDARIACRRQDEGAMDKEWSPLQSREGRQERGQPARRRKRPRLLILALILALVALLGAALTAPAVQRWGGLPWSALFSPFALTRLFAP